MDLRASPRRRLSGFPLVLLTFALQGCGDDPVAPGPTPLEPYSFEATVRGGIEGTVRGSVVAGAGRAYESNPMRMMVLEGQFPDGEEHAIVLHFLSSNPRSGSYAVAPQWSPGDPLGAEEVGVLFADVTEPGLATYTHEAASGGVRLEVTTVVHAKGEMDVRFIPAPWLDVTADEILAEARFRLK